ncbi:MAG: hypothetical protein WBA57_08225 [Elainellaceae cyanobacterium]
MVFLLLLAIAFGTAAALLLLIVGVLEAPWPVLTGILVLGLLATQRISNENRELRQDMTAFNDHAKQTKVQAKIKSKPKHSSGRRGESESEQATSETKSGNSAPMSSAVTYRGVADLGDHSPILSDGAIAQGLTYRGIAYGEATSAHSQSDSPPAQASDSTPSTDKNSPSATQASPADASDLAPLPSPQNGLSPEISPVSPQTTLIEGTYRGRHWERVVSLPANDSSAQANSSPNPGSPNLSSPNPNESNSNGSNPSGTAKNG